MSDRDTVLEMKEAVEASEQGWRDIREEAREDIRMLAGYDHWPEIVRAEREGQQRPCLTINQLPQFVSRVTGENRLANFSIKIRPQDDEADPQTAEVLEGLVRAIQYESVAEVAYRNALQYSAAGGFGWFRVDREYERWDAFEQVIKINPVWSPFSVYPDPRSFRHDLTDAGYVVALEEMPLALYEKRWPDASTDDVQGGTGDKKRKWTNDRDKTITVGEYWRQVPRKVTLWLIGHPEDPTTHRTIEAPPKDMRDLFVAELAAAGLGVLRERKVDSYKMESSLVSAGDVLEKWEEQPGRYYPFIPVLGESFVADNERHVWGLVRHAKDAQKMFNYQWSSAVEQVAMQPRAPYILTAKQLGNYSSWWKAANKGNLPYLVYDPDPSAPPPSRQQPPTVPAAALTLAESAKGLLRDTTGIYDASLGERSSEKSGVAIRERKMAANVTTATWPDNLRLAMEHAGRVIVGLIPIVYDTARTVRILGEDLNQQDILPVNDGQIDLTRGRYDVAVTVGPAFSTRREEALAQTIEFGRLMGDAFLMVADLVVNYSDFPGKDELAQRIQQIQQMQMGQGAPAPPQGDPAAMLEQMAQGVPGMPPGMGGPPPGMM